MLVARIPLFQAARDWWIGQGGSGLVVREPRLLTTRDY
jgi:hypothetical protein